MTSIDQSRQRYPQIRLLVAAALVVIGGFLFASPRADAATHVYYGDAVFTPYQLVGDTTNAALNYTRMSTQHPREVRAGITFSDGINFLTWYDPDYFVQNPTSRNGQVVQGAYCRNWSAVNVYGYCAWYD